LSIRFKPWLEALAYLVLPNACVYCGVPIPGSDVGLCSACHHELEPVSPEYEEHYKAIVASSSINQFAIGFNYGPVFQEILENLKYNNARRNAIFLGELLRQQRLSDAFCKQHVFVPIPLHRKKERKRGYNQAALIARGIGATVSNLLMRAINNPTQTKLDKEQRKANVEGIFAIDPQQRLTIATDTPLCLVDDVATSGATLNAAADVLAGAGYRDISATAVATPIMDDFF
jgi:ComF family protein